MILYDLKCDKGHVFETWFADSAAYDKLAKAGAVTCPDCASTKVEKAPMAPRINKGAEKASKTPEAAAQRTAVMGEAMTALRALREKVEENFEHVGGRFPEEARKIHYGEAEERNIYGDATESEAKALNEEGVEIQRVPWLPDHDA
ncbi:MAG: DUF1178 family protein [Alphaproteobacteria bacterium]